MPRIVPLTSLVALMACFAAGAPLGAQQFEPPSPRSFDVLSANLVFGGLTAGIAGSLQGRGFFGSAARGALGAAVHVAGKQIASSDAAVLGLVGRQVSAVGASITRNAATGSSALDTLIFPLGPLHIAWAPRTQRLPTVRVDAEDLGWITYGVASDRYSIDWSRSIWAGAVVFTTRGGVRDTSRGAGVVAGVTGGGVILLSEDQLRWKPRNLQHELTHVLQTDFLELTVGLPLERWLLGELGWSERLPFRYVDLGLAHLPLQSVLRPLLEVEADRYETRGR